MAETPEQRAKYAARQKKAIAKIWGGKKARAANRAATRAKYARKGLNVRGIR